MDYNGTLHSPKPYKRRLALILLLVLLALFLFFRAKREQAAPVYIVYTAVFETDASVARTLHTGEVLTDARGKEAAGEILGVTCETALREDAVGVYPYPQRVTVAVTLGAEGRRTDAGVAVGTLTPRVGETVYLYGSARLEGLCVRVRAI